MTTKEIEQAFDISNMLPNRVLKDDAEILQFIKHCVGISKAFTESFTIDKSVLDKIRAEIEERKLNGGGEPNRALAFNVCLQIIDKYRTESEDKK